MDFINLKAQYQHIKSDLDEAFARVFDRSIYIMGPEVKELESTLADYVGTHHCITCGNGTDALMLSMMALDIKSGDEVITTPFTFISTTETISFLGATPVFVDIEPETYNLDISQIEAKITPRTKAIMPVSLYGQTPDMDAINQIANTHGIPVIEDAAQSFGAEYQGKKSCNLSTLGCTSFYPAKPLGCYGDGGAIFTNDDALAERLRLLRNHGQNKKYSHQVIGVNSRLDALQAAVLQAKMKTFPEEVIKRNELGREYSLQFAKNPRIITPVVKPDRTHVYGQYSIRVKDGNRETITQFLKEKGIPTAVHYPIPLYKQEVYRSMEINPDQFPITEEVSESIFSLPMSPFLTQEEIQTVVSALEEACA